VRTTVAVIGSGNIGSDLMIKVIRLSKTLEMGAMVGIDPESDGLARARSLGVATTDEGIAGLLELPVFADIGVVFDATSAKAHLAHAQLLEPYGKILIDLTPAAIGPFVVPAVNLAEHREDRHVSMVSCGGQATIPVVAAVARVAPVCYAEIVASIASKSAGPGTRANIDEFTQTTARAIEVIGGAERGKAIIVLNPGEPPMIMRDTVLCLVGDADPDHIRTAVQDMTAEVAKYVPGYRLKQGVQVDPVPDDQPLATLIGDSPRPRWQVSVFLEIEGAAHYLPAYAGNLDIMTSAALRTAEQLSAKVSPPAHAEVTE
jgi:acetaldehyde dehydrogenase